MSKLNIQEIEKNLLKYWESQGIYKFKPSKQKVYSIDMPPPTVSGAMHIGHAFSYSQQDFIARYKRMQGFSVFYPFGTDDNGLPTERLVERLNKVKSKDMSRSEFIKLCLKTLKEITPKFIQDWKDLGISCDYTKYYSTIDKNSQKISQQSFLDLYNKKLIYLDSFPTLYCPECQTPIAQAELEDKELSTTFNTLAFKANNKTLPIATTRPELLPACVAVFINPSDKRYKSLIGKKAKTPLFNQEVPILADKSAEIDKGTGVLMVCSYGDKYDVAAIKRHNLKPRIIFNEKGHLTINQYKGLPIKEARKKILHDLKEKNLVLESKPINHAVNTHDKCGTEIEFLPSKQWFTKILGRKKDLIKEGKKINWKPEFMLKRYENWVNNLEWDWSISRERHFGVPIPAWHCESCKKTILAKPSELPVDPLQTKKVCESCKKPATPETKVLDTWATSSLTPQIASSLVKPAIKLPYSLRPQAHDIIRTWAFYTIIKAYYHESQIPWKDIAISGFVTLKGQKMSKSKGNVISPQKIIEEYGADSLRYWAATSKLGEDLDYQEKDIITGKKFSNKILNAANFIFMNLQYQKKKPKLLETDENFLSLLDQTIKACTEAFDNYNYARSTQLAETFFWKMFADNYLEIVKKRVYNGTKEEKASAFYTLYQSLLTILKLMAPITPFITEHIYQTHFKKYESSKSLHLTSWPKPSSNKKSSSFVQLCELLSQVRQEKSKAKKAMNSEIILSLPSKDIKSLGKTISDFQAVTNAKEIKPGIFKVQFT